jgi:hypothetical protein
VRVSHIAPALSPYRGTTIARQANRFAEVPRLGSRARDDRKEKNRSRRGILVARGNTTDARYIRSLTYLSLWGRGVRRIASRRSFASLRMTERAERVRNIAARRRFALLRATARTRLAVASRRSLIHARFARLATRQPRSGGQKRGGQRKA